MKAEAGEQVKIQKGCGQTPNMSAVYESAAIVARRLID